MKFIVAGRVHPERASVTVPVRHWRSGHDVSEFWCINSQFHLVLIRSDIEDLNEAALVAEHIAQTLIDALGFRLGACYKAEVTNVLAEDGRSMIPSVGEQGLAFEEVGAEFQILDAAKNDIHMRLALRDYLAAIIDRVDCMYLCYRSIEGVAKHFSPGSGNTVWKHMHAALGTDSTVIKKLGELAKEARHGNWSQASIPGPRQREAALELVRQVLVLYERHLRHSTN